jgi:hypothetical protein
MFISICIEERSKSNSKIFNRILLEDFKMTLTKHYIESVENYVYAWRIKNCSVQMFIACGGKPKRVSG